MAHTLPVLCCCSCYPASTPIPTKPHNDPNHEIHSMIYASFLKFCLRNLTFQPLSAAPTPPYHGIHTICQPQDLIPKPVLTPETLANNPIKMDSPYIIHLQARVNFGPVVAHRYFLCPLDLRGDWAEVSQVHFFAEGYPFGLKAMKWGISCDEHSMFFQLTLRPNLRMRFHPDDVRGQRYLVPDQQRDGEQQIDNFTTNTETRQYPLYGQQTKLHHYVELDQPIDYQHSMGVYPSMDIDQRFDFQYLERKQPPVLLQRDTSQHHPASDQNITQNQHLFSDQIEGYEHLSPIDHGYMERHSNQDMNQYETHSWFEKYQQESPFQIDTQPPFEPSRKNLASVLERQLYRTRESVICDR